MGDPRSFERDHWAKRPLLRKAPPGGVSPFEEIAALADLDHMVTSLGLTTSSFRMVREGKPLPASGYTRARRKRAGTETSVDPAAVLERFGEGATIVLEGLHHHWRPLARFARELELDLGHRIQVNAYVTPPGSQGFSLHSDDHDVFVLQVAGSKRWIVQDRDGHAGVLIEDELKEGDALYIPTGFPHSATAVDRISAHLTVGILTYDGSEIVRELFKMAEEDGAFAERLPLRLAEDEDGLRRTVSDVKHELETWIGKLDEDELGWRVRRRLVTTQQELLEGQLERLDGLDRIDDATSVRRRPLTACVLRAGSGGVRVLLSDRELEMPSFTSEAMAFIARQDRFAVADLDPWLDASSRLVLVRRLIKEGLLEVVVDG